MTYFGVNCIKCIGSKLNKTISSDILRVSLLIKILNEVFLLPYMVTLFIFLRDS